MSHILYTAINKRASAAFCPDRATHRWADWYRLWIRTAEELMAEAAAEGLDETARAYRLIIAEQRAMTKDDPELMDIPPSDDSQAFDRVKDHILVKMIDRATSTALFSTAEFAALDNYLNNLGSLVHPDIRHAIRFIYSQQ